MSVDPVVRSVRVAVVLSDRFAEILKGPDTVHSQKQTGALVGISGDQTAMSLRIGEAQQLYPEIWRHLDDARTALATRGTEVAAYDAIRAAEGGGLGAAVEVVATVHGGGQHAIEQQVKSANFNRAGLARAKQAIEALVQATPEIDWVAIARAEAEDPAVVAFGRSTRLKRWTKLALLVLVLASPFVYLLHKDLKSTDHHDTAEPVQPVVVPVSDQEQAEVAAMAGQLHGELATARARWANLVAPKSLAAIVAGSEPCAFPFVAPDSHGAEQFIRDGNGEALGASTFASYDATAPIQDDQLSRMTAIVDAVQARLTAHRVDHLDRKRLTDLEPYVVFIVIDHEVEPVITATAPQIAFTPGQVTGRGYVFSVESGQIVCAATIDARNAQPSTDLDRVRRKPEAADVLHRELEVRIRQALATGLHRVGA
ncbi:MAG: hypothetical protein ABI591_09830 [Kofleriaceae bacterium]